MPKRFQNLHFHIAEEGAHTKLTALTGASALRGVGGPVTTQATFHSDEAAARFYLDKFLQQDERASLRSLTAPDQPDVVPDLRLIGTQEVEQTRTRVVRFEQTRAKIPIFGSLAVVELDRNRELVSINAEVAEVKGVSPIASISQTAAIEAIAKKADIPMTQLLDKVEPPELTFFHREDKGTWHLAYLVRRVPAAPKEFVAAAASRKSHGHGLGKSPRSVRPVLNYLVDAHSGEVLFYYSATPMINIPSKCRGMDEHGNCRDFMGQKTCSGGFEMWDPLRSIGTYDLQMGDIDTVPFPTVPVQNTQNDWQNLNTAAVSAHVNGVIVYTFYKSVLVRDGIDDKGMSLTSVVNCCYPAGEPPPEWHNAVWYDNRMWYGQVKNPNGQFESYSRYLDVIAHELTHGITEKTSNLVYQGQSGALNESFSDIFGVMINNWHLKRWNSVANWDWEIGPGLGSSNLPLRDMSDPTRTGDPDHMNQYLNTLNDNGGVHTNSNIHNKAVYNVLTAKNTAGNYTFTPEEAATLFYLCLTRLNSIATFSSMLQVLIDVANTYYAGNPGERQEKTDAIRQAYQKVGIQ